MRIDLHQALGDIAASVEDDVAADRLSGRVHHMVSRVRRRRAARYTAQGAVGVGTAAAVAVVGVNVAGHRGPDLGPPATTSPEPGPTGDGLHGLPGLPPLTCADAAPEPTGTVHGLALEIDVPRTVGAGDPVAVTGTLRNVGGTTVHLGGTGTGVELVAVLDGHVTGTTAAPSTSGGEVPADGRLRPGDEATMTEEATLAACGTVRTLPEGDYHVVGRTVWEVDGERVELVSEPVPFTVGDHASDGDVEPYGPGLEGTSPDDPLFDAAWEAIAGYLADPVVATTYPVCGGWLPRERSEVVRLDLHLPDTLPTGVRYDANVSVGPVEGVTVDGSVEVAAPGVVFLLDGVVVGGVPRVPEGSWVHPADFGAADPFVVPGALRTELCGEFEHTDGPALPPGTYEAVAVSAVTVDGAVSSGGRSWPGADGVVALSDPVEVTLG